MRITLDPQIPKPAGFQLPAQTPRVLNDNLLSRLNLGEGVDKTKLTYTAYRSPANGDVLIIVEGKGYLKRFVLRPDNQISSGLSSTDQKTFEAELTFHDAKKLNLDAMKENLQTWKDNKEDKLVDIQRHGPDRDGLGNPISPEEAYDMLVSEMKNNIKALQRDLALNVDVVDTRTP